MNLNKQWQIAGEQERGKVVNNKADHSPQTVIFIIGWFRSIF